MDLQIVRRIRDNVHGSIDISALEDKVIEHEFFQRLRRVKQTAFLYYVFPGASHSRFEHSLGVLYLAGVAWQKLYANQRRLAKSLNSYADFLSIERSAKVHLSHGVLAPTFGVMDKIFESEYALQALRLAALMHDLGHPPFSHSGERFLPTWLEVLKSATQVSQYLKDYLHQQIEEQRLLGKDPGREKVRHEVFSLLLIDRLLNDIYRNHPKITPKVDPHDVLCIIKPEIKPGKDSPLQEFGMFRLCNELLSGELDIDRMDYLLRDSRECGVVYGIFDVGRILDSLCIYHDEIDNSMHVATQFSGLAAFEDYLRARMSMYLQVYFHKTSVAAEAMMLHLSNMLGGWAFPASMDDYAALDEHNVCELILAAAKAELKSMNEYEPFERVARDLFYNRKLWKKVFEIIGPETDESVKKAILTVEQLVKKECEHYEFVSTGNSLTRFRPRFPNEQSKNYLRLIKKDDRGFLRVAPIEDYCQLVASNAKVMIHRLYVEDCLDKNGEHIPTKVKRLLLETE